MKIETEKRAPTPDTRRSFQSTKSQQKKRWVFYDDGVLSKKEAQDLYLIQEKQEYPSHLSPHKTRDYIKNLLDRKRYILSIEEQSDAEGNAPYIALHVDFDYRPYVSLRTKNFQHNRLQQYIKKVIVFIIESIEIYVKKNYGDPAENIEILLVIPEPSKLFADLESAEREKAIKIFHKAVLQAAEQVKGRNQKYPSCLRLQVGRKNFIIRDNRSVTERNSLEQPNEENSRLAVLTVSFYNRNKKTIEHCTPFFTDSNSKQHITSHDDNNSDTTQNDVNKTSSAAADSLTNVEFHCARPKKIISACGKTEVIWQNIFTRIKAGEKIGWLVFTDDYEVREIRRSHPANLIPDIHKKSTKPTIANKLKVLWAGEIEKEAGKPSDSKSLELATQIQNGFKLLPISISHNKGWEHCTVAKSTLDHDFEDIQRHLDEGWKIMGLGNDEIFFIENIDDIEWANTSIQEKDLRECVKERFALLKALYDEGQQPQLMEEEDFYVLPGNSFRISKVEYAQLQNSVSWNEETFIQENYAVIDTKKAILDKSDQPFVQFTFTTNFKNKKSIKSRLSQYEHQEINIVVEPAKFQKKTDLQAQLSALKEQLKKNTSLCEFHLAYIDDETEKLVRTIFEFTEIESETLTDGEKTEPTKLEEMTSLNLQALLIEEYDGNKSRKESEKLTDGEKTELPQLEQIATGTLQKLSTLQLEINKQLYSIHPPQENKEEAQEEPQEEKKTSIMIGEVRFFYHREDPISVVHRLTHDKPNQKVALGISQHHKTEQQYLLIPTNLNYREQKGKEREEEESQEISKEEVQQHEVKGKEKDDELVYSDSTVDTVRLRDALLNDIQDLQNKILRFRNIFPRHPLAAAQIEIMQEELEKCRIRLHPQINDSHCQIIKEQVEKIESHLKKIYFGPQDETPGVKATKLKSAGNIHDHSMNPELTPSAVQGVIHKYKSFRNHLGAGGWNFASIASIEAIIDLQQIIGKLERNKDGKIDDKDADGELRKILYTEAMKIICTHPEKRFSERLSEIHPLLAEARVQAIREGKIITFLRGNSRTKSHPPEIPNLTIDESYLLSNLTLQKHPYYFQQWFPIKATKKTDSNTPIWKQKDIHKIIHDEQLRTVIEKRLIANLQRLLIFYGMTAEENAKNTLTILKTADFTKRANAWIYWDSPHYRIIQQVLESLELKNNNDESLFPKAAQHAAALRHTLIDIATQNEYRSHISDKTSAKWKIGFRYQSVAPITDEHSLINSFALGLKDLIIAEKITEPRKTQSLVNRFNSHHQVNDSVPRPANGFSIFSRGTDETPAILNVKGFTDYLSNTNDRRAQKELSPVLHEIVATLLKQTLSIREPKKTNFLKQLPMMIFKEIAPTCYEFTTELSKKEQDLEPDLLEQFKNFLKEEINIAIKPELEPNTNFDIFRNNLTIKSKVDKMVHEIQKEIGLKIKHKSAATSHSAKAKMGGVAAVNTHTDTDDDIDIDVGTHTAAGIENIQVYTAIDIDTDDNNTNTGTDTVNNSTDVDTDADDTDIDADVDTDFDEFESTNSPQAKIDEIINTKINELTAWWNHGCPNSVIQQLKEQSDEQNLKLLADYFGIIIKIETHDNDKLYNKWLGTQTKDKPKPEIHLYKSSTQWLYKRPKEGSNAATRIFST